MELVKVKQAKQNRAPPGTAGRHRHLSCEHPTQPNRAFQLEARTPESANGQSLPCRVRRTSRTTAPDYHTHTGKASPRRRPTTRTIITPARPEAVKKNIGEMRSKGLVPPLISHRSPTRSVPPRRANEPKRAIIYCRAAQRAKGALLP